MKFKNFSSISLSGRPEFCFEKCAKRFCQNSEKNRPEAENFHQTIFISEKSSKVSPGYVVSRIDNSLEDFLQSPKSFLWTSKDDKIYFYFNKIAFMKLFLWKRGIHFWKKCRKKPFHVPKSFRSSSKKCIDKFYFLRKKNSSPQTVPFNT